MRASSLYVESAAQLELGLNRLAFASTRIPQSALSGSLALVESVGGTGDCGPDAAELEYAPAL